MKTISLIPPLQTLLAEGEAGSNPTIESFVHSKVGESKADEGEELSKQAARLKSLGFGNSANIRLSSYLDDFRCYPQLAAYYKEKYDPCVFLPWAGLHRVMKSLDLVMDLTDMYLGAVPNSQIIGMEIFEFDNADTIHPVEVLSFFTEHVLEYRGISKDLRERDRLRSSDHPARVKNMLDLLMTCALRGECVYYDEGRWDDHQFYDIKRGVLTGRLDCTVTIPGRKLGRNYG